jgi:hypothetical protein
VIKCRQGFHLHRTAQRVAILIRRLCLAHLQRADQRRRNHIQRHRAAFTFRRRHQRAVDGHTVQIRPGAAHPHITPFTLIALQRHARHPLQRLGGIGVRQLTNVVGTHRTDDIVGRLLQVERVVQAFGLAVNHNRLQGGIGRLNRAQRAGQTQRQQGMAKSGTGRAGVRVVHVHLLKWGAKAAGLPLSGGRS